MVFIKPDGMWFGLEMTRWIGIRDVGKKGRRTRFTLGHYMNTDGSHAGIGAVLHG